MRYFHDTLYESARDFVGFFLQHAWFRTGNQFQANTTGRGGMIFRGQSDSKWELVPTAFRPDSLRDFTPQPPPRKPSGSGNLRRYLGTHLHAEGRAVFMVLSPAMMEFLEATIPKSGDPPEASEPF